MSLFPMHFRSPLGLAAIATLAASVAAACSSGPQPPPVSPPSPPPAPPPTVVPITQEPSIVDAGSSDHDADTGVTAESDAGTGGDAASSTSSGPTACPETMVLIDGEYCTDVETKCLKSHYAKQNKKTICEVFEEPSKCIGRKEHRRYCIDRYEYPNAKGERPIVMNNFPQAQHLCAAQSKRVCTETEWTMACEGPSYKPYPYGYVRDPDKCRGDRGYRFPNVHKMVSKNKEEQHTELERLWDGVVSGSQPECVSDYGVWDMPGNADELAADETPKPKGKFDNVTTGGPWLEGVRNQCRPKIYDHNEGFQYYYLSFRCCEEPDGKPTDPRSPKQLERHEKWR